MNRTYTLDSVQLPIATSVEHASFLLSLSEHQVRRYIKAGLLPTSRLGRRTLVKIEDLIRLLDTGAPSRAALEIEQPDAV